MKAVIRKKEAVARMTDYVEFDTGKPVSFTPGQYFFVTLDPSDKLHKEDLTHHLSIVNSPNQKNTLALATRMRVERSLFKRTIDAAKIGDEVEIGKIEGTFVLPDSTDKPIVMVALGIGITPFISMLRYSFEEDKPYKFKLFYSDGEAQSMPFLDELNKMATDHDNLELVTIITKEEDWQGESRHVDGEMLKDYMDDIKVPVYFVSGPPDAAFAVAKSLKDSGIDEDNIKVDDFYGY